MTAVDALIAALRQDMAGLLALADAEVNRDRQAAVRLAVKLIRRTVNEHAMAPQQPLPEWPDTWDAWDEFASCSACGRRNPPHLASTQRGLVCHPTCPPPALYRVECGSEFGTDLVIEVPVGIVAPGAVSSWLASRTSLLVRHQIGGEYDVDVKADLDSGFVSVNWLHHRHGWLTKRFPLVEASRTEIGGAS
ncbi:hypothetical protein ACFRCG_47955 [Embleya sp. NPDC056575]|uniref:hypothetical protein n=1 Tax=unclassified Embleya TaxID=2699296 RepID=UPI0036A798F1